MPGSWVLPEAIIHVKTGGIAVPTIAKLALISLLRPADFDFTTATIPLIPATTNLPQTSNWYELIDSEYAAYGNVRSGSLAVVSEPTTLPLAALGLVAALGLTRRRVRRRIGTTFAA